MKFLFAGGGTAGHINPAIAIAKHIKMKNPDAEFLFVGTKKGLEVDLVPREGFKLEIIKVRGFKRKISVDTLVAMKEVLQGIMQARKLIKQFKPDVVIGTGGYVCGPVLLCASRMKIPTIIHEQNAFPGVTNKILSKFVDKIAISFEDSKKFFKNKNKLILTGNPIRSELLGLNKDTAKERLKFNNNKPLLVIFAGSRGAEKINTTVTKMILNQYKNDDFNIIFATGEKQYKKIEDELSTKISDNVRVLPYIYNMAEVMSAADLVVCRAGALTISELAVLGVPSILIPSPYVTANHQEYNAKVLADKGAAQMIFEKDLECENLYSQIKKTLDDKELLNRMSISAKELGIGDATEKIYEITTNLF